MDANLLGAILVYICDYTRDYNRDKRMTTHPSGQNTMKLLQRIRKILRKPHSDISDNTVQLREMSVVNGALDMRKSYYKCCRYLCIMDGIYKYEHMCRLINKYHMYNFVKRMKYPYSVSDVELFSNFCCSRDNCTLLYSQTRKAWNEMSSIDCQKWDIVVHPLWGALMDAVSTGCKAHFVSSTFDDYTGDIEDDILYMLELCPSIASVALGIMRYRDAISPLYLACINPYISMRVIEALLRASRHNPCILVAGSPRPILVDLMINNLPMEESRYMAIRALFQKHDPEMVMEEPHWTDNLESHVNGSFNKYETDTGFIMPEHTDFY